MKIPESRLDVFVRTPTKAWVRVDDMLSDESGQIQEYVQASPRPDPGWNSGRKRGTCFTRHQEPAIPKNPLIEIPDALSGEISLDSEARKEATQI